MSLSAGTKIGPYEILAPLGAGGMGEVYRARDTRLQREVALKVIADSFAGDSERMARFQREAQLLAAINHANIAGLYGLEMSGGMPVLVMELVPGQTLAEHIALGSIPVEEAIPLARQIAEALECAHERGIIHRDLKPANIKVLPDGRVKVLDFGLAKALDAENPSSSALSSPTLTASATKMGVILGTAAYMSPEQAKGRTLDQRSDLWSFGCVLYEMLTGRIAFSGETVTDTLAAVVRGEPDWNALPVDTPASVRQLLERCLRKDSKQRLQSAGDARITLEEARVGEVSATPAGAVAAASSARTVWMALPWLVAVTLALSTLLLWHPWRGASPSELIRLTSDLGIEGNLYTGYGSALILSPDGSRVAYVVEDDRRTRHLWWRSFDQIEPKLLAGTEGARDPFFSPDGQWIGFFSGTQLKKVSVEGGVVVTLCAAQDDRGAAWGEDGTIILAPETRAPLQRIPAGGGSPAPFSKLSGNEVTHRWPQFLPGGKVVIYTSSDDGNNYENSDIVAQVIATGERKTLYRGGYAPHYLTGGYLEFVHQGTVFGLRFDLRSLKVTSQPVPLIGGILTAFGNAGAQISFSSSGRAAYLSGGSANMDLFELAWLTTNGHPEPLAKEPKTYWALAFSPDGNLLANSIEEHGSQDIFVSDWKRIVATRLTFGSATNVFPAWAPDGKHISYVTDETGGRFSISWKPATGAGDKQILLESDQRVGPMSWHPNGKVLVFAQTGERGIFHLRSATLQGNEKTGWKLGDVKPLADGPAQENMPAFSPDGKWLAYQSNETGSWEVFVRPFPGPGGRWQVSHGEGFSPSWSHAKQELFFVSGSNQLMSVPFSTSGDSFSPGTPQLWNSATLGDRGVMHVNYALHPDGKRVAFIQDYSPSGKPELPRLTYVFNFLTDVQQKLEKATTQ